MAKSSESEMEEFVSEGLDRLIKFDSIVIDFPRWESYFNMVIYHIKLPKEKKVLFLLRMIEPHILSILERKVAPLKAIEVPYEQLASILQDISENIPKQYFYRHKFYTRNQEENEPVRNFYKALQSLSMECNFGDNRDVAVKLRFIWGLAKYKIQNQLLEIDNLTLEKALYIAEEMELAELFEKYGFDLYPFPVEYN